MSENKQLRTLMELPTDIDQFEQLTGYVADLRRAVEHGTRADAMDAIDDIIPGLIRAEVLTEIDNTIGSLCSVIKTEISYGTTALGRRSLPGVVAAIEWQLELEAGER